MDAFGHYPGFYSSSSMSSSSPYITATSQFYARTGIDSAPGYSFTDEKGLGIERTETGTIAVAASGSQTLVVSPDQLSGPWGQISSDDSEDFTYLEGLPYMITLHALTDTPTTITGNFTANNWYRLQLGGTIQYQDTSSTWSFDGSSAGSGAVMTSSAYGAVRVSGTIQWTTTCTGVTNLFMKDNADVSAHPSNGLIASATAGTITTPFSVVIVKFYDTIPYIAMQPWFYTSTTQTSSPTVSCTFHQITWERLPQYPPY
jgi:hypothetical protein